MEILKVLFRKCIAHKWNIGFIAFDKHILTPEYWHIHWMQHSYKDRWFADPFVLDIDENFIYVLVEEFLDATQLGRISKLTIDKSTFKLQEIEPILELTTHLSFPALLRFRGRTFLYPENSASGSLHIYEYTEGVVKEWMVVNEPLTDAVIIEHDNSCYLLSTKQPNPNGNKLDVWKLDIEGATYEWIESYSFRENTARNAGLPFIYENRLIRCTQDCNHGYGMGIVFEQMAFGNNKIDFKEILRYYSRELNVTGFHTFNKYEEFCVVDARMYRIPFLANLFLTTRNLIYSISFLKR